MENESSQIFTEGQMELCIECAALNFIEMFGEAYSFERHLDDFLANSSCPFCLLLVRCLAQESAFASAFAHPEQKRIQVRSEEMWGYEVRDIKYTVRWLRLSILGEASGGRKMYGCSIQQLRSAPSGNPTDGLCYLWGRRTYDELDIALLRSWLEDCHHYHQSCEPKAALPAIPKLLIEVDTKSVIHASADCQYAALSYVWGPPHISQLRHKDLPRGANGWLLKPSWATVPQTIKDAMSLCVSLSIPFLWVDALCIEEYQRDSSANCNTELSEQMSTIYGAAHLTIVAAAGDDSWAGLPGVRKGSRAVLQQTAVVGSLLLASVQNSPSDIMESTTWNRRAWTCQEGYLSARLLIFTKHQVFWSCNSYLFCEDIHREESPDELGFESMLDPHGGDFLQAKRDLHTPSLEEEDLFDCYARLVQNYTGRDLTYQQDALDAFGGVIGSLRNRLETDFLYGLPLRYFEQSLLFDTGCFLPESRREGFPSWAWVGWNQKLQGGNGISFPQWHCFHCNEFTSLAAWYRFDHSQGEPELAFGVFKLVEGIANQGALELEKRARFRYSLLPEYVNPSQVLVLETSSTFLQVQIDPVMENHPLLSRRFTVHIPGGNSKGETAEASTRTNGKSVGSLMLDSTWRRMNKGVSEFEFIAIVRETSELFRETDHPPRKAEKRKNVIHALMITTDLCGISQRLQVITVDEQDWVAAKPTQRTVYLV
jgi:hypothetical protein